MAGRDAQVRVEITADDKAAAVVRNVGREIEGLAGQVQGLGSLLSAASLGLGPGMFIGLVAGMAELAKATADYEQEIYHASAVTAVSVENLSGLRVAAEENKESFESLSMSLGRLGKNIGEGLAEPTSKAGKDLATLFSQTDLGSLKLKSVDDRIQTVLAAIFGLTDANDRQLLMSDLLGRGWQSNIETLRALATEGYTPLIDKAKKLGEYSDAAHAEAANQFEVKWNDLKASFAGTAHVVGDELIPSMTQLFSLLTNTGPAAAETFRNLWREISAGSVGVRLDVSGMHGDQAGTQDAGAASEALAREADAQGLEASAAELVNHTVGAEANAHRELAVVLANVAKAHQNAARAAIEYKDPIAKLLQPILQEYDTLGMTGDRLRLYTLATAGASQADQDFASRLLSTIGVQKTADKQRAEGMQAVEQERQSLEDFSKAITEEVQTPAEKAQATLDRLTRAFNEGAISADTYHRATNQTQNDLDLLKLKAEEAKAPMDQLSDTEREAGQMAHSFEEDVAQNFASAIVGAESFGEAIQRIVQDLAEMILKMLIFRELKKAFGDESSDTGGGGGGWLGSVFGGILGAFGGKASGGGVDAGTPYMVGEEGPEPFIPDVSGTILPHSAIGGGGTVINQYFQIDARGADAAVEYKIARAAVAMQKNAAKLARLQMLDAAARG